MSSSLPRFPLVVRDGSLDGRERSVVHVPGCGTCARLSERRNADAMCGGAIAEEEQDAKEALEDLDENEEDRRDDDAVTRL